jgi:hypothetical protein
VVVLAPDRLEEEDELERVGEGDEAHERDGDAPEREVDLGADV